VTCATYSINCLVFITDIKSVYSAVRTGSLNKAVCASSLKGKTYISQLLAEVSKFSVFYMIQSFSESVYKNAHRFLF
jgi:hypothetical protein